MVTAVIQMLSFCWGGKFGLTEGEVVGADVNVALTIAGAPKAAVNAEDAAVTALIADDTFLVAAVCAGKAIGRWTW